MTDRRATIIAALTEQAEGLDLIAEECEAIAKHFRPRFEACWERPLIGCGALKDQKTALSLRSFVIDREADAKRMRKEAQELRDAISELGA